MPLALPQEILTHRTKGIPGGTPSFDIADIARWQWNVLQGDMPLPLAILRESVLAANAGWMRAFCDHHRVSLAPHGKTTMAPKLFERQLADGAWAITLATAHQVQVARDCGIGRILVANQVVDPAFLHFVMSELDRDPGFDLLLLVDSVEAVRLLVSAWRAGAHARPVGVLIEVGAGGGRTGVRTAELAMAIGDEISRHPEALTLRGVEAFEGIFSGSADAKVAPVDALLGFATEVARGLDGRGLFAGEIVLSAGGSAYFDRVVSAFSAAGLSRPTRIVLRSGCYIAHDGRLYADYLAALGARVPEGFLPPGTLAPALSVLARVQSLPEPGLALLTAGKRDLSYDSHLPIPTHVYRHGTHAAPLALGQGHEIVALADQHAFMRLPPDAALAVGDIVLLDISHPCTTFDKWDVLYGVDDAFNVVEAYKTYF